MEHAVSSRPHLTWTSIVLTAPNKEEPDRVALHGRPRSSEPQAKDVPSRRLCGFKFDPHGSLARSDYPDQTARLTGPNSGYLYTASGPL